VKRLKPLFAILALASPFAPAVAAQPESEQQLLALAQTQDVQLRNMPFAQSPPSDQSLYATMPDGTRLALNLYFPQGFDRGAARAPAVYVQTIYGRNQEAAVTPIELYRRAGFVVVIGDVRGFGASFGYQEDLFGAQMQSDQRATLNWIAAQPWSNGKVAVIGLSISATPADITTGSGSPVLKAAVLRGEDFDLYEHDVFPGGVPNLRILALVQELYAGHRADACRASLAACTKLSQVIQPVDGDSELRQLQAAVADRARLDEHVLERVVYRDDHIGNRTVGDASASAHVQAMRRAALPVRVGASWLDGTTAASALDRFALLPDAPMQVVISSATHPGGLDADPFSTTAFQPARPDALAQFSADVEFVQGVLSGAPVERSVDYFVLGADVWKNTKQWPPADAKRETMLLSATGLTEVGEPVKTGEMTYAVDPTTSSGALNRWSGQLGNPIRYGDRRDLSGRRLSLDTAPVSQDMELVGAAELCLVFRTDRQDGLLAAYLEDVAPDGRVTYLTEGVLRLLHRKTQGRACDPAPGTRRSFSRADGAPVTPGELMHVELAFLPTAALIRQGHRLRLSLAGADAGTFPPLPAAAAATTWNVAYGSADASRVLLPLRPWSAR
jgi:uncharacterized protein